MTSIMQLSRGYGHMLLGQVLLCMVLLGNTYPITRKTDYPYPDIMAKDSVSTFHYLHPIPYNFERQAFDIPDS